MDNLLHNLEINESTMQRVTNFLLRENRRNWEFSDLLNSISLGKDGSGKIIVDT